MWLGKLSCQAQVAVWSVCVSGLALLVFVAASGVMIRHEFQELIQSSATSLAAVAIVAVEDGDTDLNRWLPGHEEELYQIVAIIREDGTELFKEDELWSDDLVAVLDGGGYAFSPDGFWQIHLYRNNGSKIYVAVSLTEMEEEYLEFVLAFALALPFALALVGWGGWWLGGKVARPIVDMANAVSEVNPGELKKRVPGIERPDEIGDLARLTNGMLERIEQGYAQARRFTGDASHELRTPLAILQSELEQRIQEADASGGDQESNGRMLDEVRRLKALTNSLLFLARVDAGTLEIDEEEIGLSELFAEILDEMRCSAFGEPLKWEVDCPADAKVLGEPNLVRQLLRNLLRNAALYNREGGRVSVEVCPEGEQVRIKVGNTGLEVPESSRERLFERFFRCEQERSRRRDGFGLGLNISQAIAQAHGGRLTLDDAREDWTLFSVTLPSSAGR